MYRLSPIKQKPRSKPIHKLSIKHLRVPSPVARKGKTHRQKYLHWVMRSFWWHLEVKFHICCSLLYINFYKSNSGTCYYHISNSMKILELIVTAYYWCNDLSRAHSFPFLFPSDVCLSMNYHLLTKANISIIGLVSVDSPRAKINLNWTFI